MTDRETVQQVAILRAVNFMERGGLHYSLRQLRSACGCFRHALALALTIEDKRFEAFVRHELGNSLMQLGSLREAVDVMAPAFGEHLRNQSRDSASTIFRLMARYVEIAQQIPIAASKIDQAYSEMDNFLTSYDLAHYRAEALVMRSRLLRFQGRIHESFTLALEALGSRRLQQDAYGQVLDYHYDGIVTLCVDLGMIDDANTFLAAWLNEKDIMPENRRLRYAKCAAEAAARAGDLRNAKHYSEQALYYARHADYEEAQAAALFAYCRVFTMDRQLAEVRRALCEFSRLRRSERAYVRRELWLWWVACFGRSQRIQASGIQQEQKVLPAKMALRTSETLNKLLRSDFWVTQAEAHIRRDQGWFR
jgi:hypothetical protein